MAVVLIAVAGGAGYFFGPVGAAVVVAVVGLVVFARVVMLMAEDAANRPAVVTSGLMGPTDNTDQRLFDGMMGWIVIAIVVRLFMVLFLNATPLWRSFAPDALGWEAFGQRQLDYWTGAVGYPEVWMQGLNGQTLYAGLNAVSLWLFGTARYPLSILNAMIGIVAAAVFARLAEEIWDAKVGRRTFLLGLFFPSMMVWTCMSIREAWAYLALGLFLLGLQKLRNEIALTPVLLVLVALPMLLAIRTYLVPLVVVASALSLVVVRVRQLPYALVALGLLTLVIGGFGEELGITTELASDARLEEAHRLRNGLAYGGSSYGTEADTRTWSGLVAYLPEGIVRFLFSPFPWAIRSWRQAITLPESLVWMYLFYQAMRGIWQQARRNLAAIATPWFVCTLITLAYAVVSGNEGTAYRHRAQVMIVLFMFAAVHQVRGRASAAAPAPASAEGLAAT